MVINNLPNGHLGKPKTIKTSKLRNTIFSIVAALSVALSYLVGQDVSRTIAVNPAPTSSLIVDQPSAGIINNNSAQVASAPPPPTLNAIPTVTQAAASTDPVPTQVNVAPSAPVVNKPTPASIVNKPAPAPVVKKPTPRPAPTTAPS